MHFSLFQYLIIFSVLVFFLLSFRLYKTKKIPFVVFFLSIVVFVLLICFVLNTTLLDNFGSFFGIDRGSYLIVYSGIIVLTYLYISLLNEIKQQDITQTKIIRELSINNAKGNLEGSETVFIIPAYNEKDSPIESIGKILNKGYGVILIDDGKNEGLIEKLHQIYKGKQIVTIQHVLNLGQGGALETGSEYVRRYGKSIKYIVHFDADGQHRLEDIVEFENAFRKDSNLEIVLGSRFLGSTVNMPKSKELTLKMGIIFTWIISGIKLTDTHNGYRMMKKDALDKINITMNRMEHASEIIDIIKAKKMNYKEVPIVVLYTEYSISKGQKISNAIKIAKNLIYKKIFFR